MRLIRSSVSLTIYSQVTACLHLLVDGVLQFDVCTLFICVFRLESYPHNFDCQAPQLLQPNLADVDRVLVLGAVIILLVLFVCVVNFSTIVVVYVQQCQQQLQLCRQLRHLRLTTLMIQRRHC